MTKFIDKIADMRFHGIVESKVNYLLYKLESFLKSNKKSIFIIVHQFQKSKKTYKIVELSDTIIMVLNLCDKRKIILNVGYPFPIFSRDRDDFMNDFAGNVEIKFFIRGEILRKIQRDYLKKVFLDSFLNNKWIIINKIEKFRRLSVHFLKRGKRIIYVDPYHFIGDAFTGLYFLDKFKTQNKITDIVILSKFFKHLGLFYKSYEKNSYNLKKICVNDSIIVMPDLIDNHFGESLELLECIKGKNVVVFVPGRNLIISYQKDEINAYHLNEKDVLLRNKNIEDYMDDCLNSFLKNQYRQSRKKINNSSKVDVAKIFVSPYSSDPLKEISVNLFLKIACELSENINVRFIVSKNNGVSNVKNKWISKFLQKAKVKKYKKIFRKIKFISDKNINDLGEKLLKERVTCALVADTSISHVLSRLMIPNITVYNEHFWDRESMQSLSAESPLGFCRYDLPQFAAILTENDELNKFSNSIKSALQTLLNVTKDGSKSFSEKIPQEIYKFYEIVNKYVNYSTKSLNYRDHKKLYSKYLILKKHFIYSEFAWLFDIYDPDRLIKGINGHVNIKNSFLVYSSWKNLPLYKFIDYFVK